MNWSGLYPAPAVVACARLAMLIQAQNLWPSDDRTSVRHPIRRRRAQSEWLCPGAGLGDRHLFPEEWRDGMGARFLRSCYLLDYYYVSRNLSPNKGEEGLGGRTHLRLYCGDQPLKVMQLPRAIPAAIQISTPRRTDIRRTTSDRSPASQISTTSSLAALQTAYSAPPATGLIRVTVSLP